MRCGRWSLVMTRKRGQPCWLVIGTARCAAVDVTFSAPKSVSLLWAFGTAATSSVVSIAVSGVSPRMWRCGSSNSATAVSGGSRLNGIRVRVPTAGWAAGHVHASDVREGDPQLHLHCIENPQRGPPARREPRGAGRRPDARVAEGGRVDLLRQELQRRLSQQLGVGWRADRGAPRELTGFSREQLREFSKRTLRSRRSSRRRGSGSTPRRSGCGPMTTPRSLPATRRTGR